VRAARPAAREEIIREEEVEETRPVRRVRFAPENSFIDRTSTVRASPSRRIEETREEIVAPLAPITPLTRPRRTVRPQPEQIDDFEEEFIEEETTPRRRR
jgi:hypothetical protein